MNANLKKIHVADVRLGMYVHEVCGSWMDHPFWKKTFKVSNANMLKTLQDCGIQEVWIDVSKGLDVGADAEAFSEEDEKLKVDETLLSAVKTVKKSERTVELHQELGRARMIHARAKKEVTSMFQEARMGKALQLEQAESLVEEISQSIMRNQCALLSLARLKNKDDYTYLHSVAVCALMIALGRQLGMEGDALRQAGMAGLLHDIGKIMTPEEVLNKPGSLTREEFDIMKQHPRSGWEILKIAPGVSEISLDVCLHHHERLDGKGYPEKLSGESISLFARMGAVCDVYDAITSTRCYKSGWDPAEAIRKMAEWKDGNYDESVFHAFVKTVGIYPIGTLVSLASGRLGVVADQSADSLLTPKVVVFYSGRQREHLYPEMMDLSKSLDEIAGIEKPSDWKFDPEMLQGLVQLGV
ncbi:MAG: HD-GYP domain-containing protein [Gallionella sp.]|jgi:putative nucleotidyltransferase with HDIG domain|nr:HD-GYP domain-containing protein [Gallionella sp.]MCK9353632.1 HD-GYP domain-containing protein [Gallionella sp.]